MSLESFSRLSQAIVNASEATSEEAKTKAQKEAALVVNSIGAMSTPKRTARPSAFSEDADFLGNAIQKARAEKLAANRETDAEKPKAQKSLADLLTEAAAE